jgi:hypothetical protein
MQGEQDLLNPLTCPPVRAFASIDAHQKITFEALGPRYILAVFCLHVCPLGIFLSLLIHVGNIKTYSIVITILVRK